jgi:hypothetical protein
VPVDCTTVVIVHPVVKNGQLNSKKCTDFKNLHSTQCHRVKSSTVEQSRVQYLRNYIYEHHCISILAEKRFHPYTTGNTVNRVTLGLGRVKCNNRIIQPVPVSPEQYSAFISDSDSDWSILVVEHRDVN